MDVDALAQALFGGRRAEEQEVSTNATTRTYMGVAVSDSSDGTVRVDLGGDVTLPDDLYDDDGNVVAEWNGAGIEMSTSPQVKEGQDVIVTLVGGTSTKRPMVTAVAGEGDYQNERIGAIEADYVKATELEADVADIGFLKADSATIADLQADTAKVHDLTADQLTAATGYVGELQAGSVSAQDIVAGKATVGQLAADHVSVSDLDAATARIGDLEADHVSVSDFSAEQANIDSLQAATADIDTIRANSAKVQNLTAAQLEADHATVGSLSTTYATISNLNAANGRIDTLESTKANISDLEADYITADVIEATYMHSNMSNSDVAWIENGTIKNGAIVSAMINDVSANKLTAGTINGSVINVTNLNADNITTGTINGQRIGDGSLSLSKLDESVYTEAEVNSIVDGLNDRIDGAIETFTGTVIPTLNNSPASSWNTTKLRDEHVGDVYYVVNSQSQQNGYCYRFTKSGNTYSWQLIKDSDVTAALSRLTAAEGKITTFDSDISTLKTDTGTLTTRTTNLETRADDVDEALLDKVDVTTFNEVSDTVDAHTQTISQHTTAISNKADSSTVTAVTNRVSKNEQDISGINTTIGELQDTVETKADGSTVSTISNKLNTVSDTVDGHTQTISSVQNTLSTKADSSTVSTLTTKVNTVSDTVDGHTQRLSSVEDTLETKADGSTVSTISTKVNNISDTVDGHTSQLQSVTSTQTSMQSTLDKTVKSSIQLWYSKANTTAPSKPTSQVTSTSTSGNAWRIVVPAYNSSYPHYFYCWQYEYVDGTYGWSAVVRDIAMGESQSTARTADSSASAAATTANANIKSSVQLWFTKANSTAPSKPTSVVNTSNANTANAWNLVVPVWNSSYPHYYYCYQQQKGDGTYQWTDVVYDRATSEAQQLANTTSTNLSTLQTDYATFKQTTEQFESTVGSRLTTIESDIDGVEERVSDNETSISNNASAISLKANSSDVYTKTAVDGKITQEVTDRNAAITAKANEITSTVSQNYTTKQESQQAIDYVANAENNYGFQYHKDIVVFGDSDKYYPVYFTNLTSQTVTHEVMIMRNYAEQAPDDWNTSTHKGSLNLRIRWNFGGWGGATYKAEITSFSEMFATILGDVVVATDGGMFSIVFLRGGGTIGALYHVYSEVPLSRNSYMQNAGVVGENDVPYVGLTEGTVYAKSGGTYQWTVRAPLTAPNTTHINQLYTVQRVVEAESSIVQTADSITSTVSKISGIKYLEAASAGWALADIKSWCAEGEIGTWAVKSAENVRVGDTVLIKGYDVTRQCNIYIKGTVNSISGNSLNITSHGYEDILPSDVAISSINQSAESVTINANRINLVGAVTIGDLASATKDAVLNSNISVGGRNYVLNSSGTLVSGLGSAAGSKKEYQALNVGLSYMDIPHGTQVTISFDLYMTVNTANPYVQVYNTNNRGPKAFSSSATGTGTTMGVSKFFTAAAGSVIDERVSVTGYINDRDTVMLSDNFLEFYSGYGTSNWFSISNIKLERGNKATDWSPAPEDVDASIAAVPRMAKINTHQRILTTAQWQTYGAYGHVENWAYYSSSTYDNSHLRVGDTAYLTGTVSDGTGGSATIIGTVTAVTTTAVQMSSTQLIFGGDSVSNAAQTATNYIVADSSGIKIANASPSSATTYLQLASNFLDFIRGGVSMLKAWIDETTATAKVRVGAESGFNTLTDDEGIKLRSGTTVLGQFATNLIELGKNSTSAVISFCNGKGKIGYETDRYGTVTLKGTEYGGAEIASETCYVQADNSGVGIYAPDYTVSVRSEHIALIDTEDTYEHEYLMDDLVNAIPVTLYDNDSASASAATTLSESAANFRRLTIMYKDSDNTYGSVDVWNPNGKRVSLDLTWINGASTQQMYQRVRWVTISGTTISTAKDSGDSKYRTGQVRLGGTYSVTNSDYISIVHVIGYR